MYLGNILPKYYSFLGMTGISVRTEPLIRRLRMARGLCCCISPSLIVEIPGMNLGLFGAYGGTTIGCRES
jgi:hypothetical protein